MMTMTNTTPLSQAGMIAANGDKIADTKRRIQIARVGLKDLDELEANAVEIVDSLDAAVGLIEQAHAEAFALARAEEPGVEAALPHVLQGVRVSPGSDGSKAIEAKERAFRIDAAKKLLARVGDRFAQPAKEIGDRLSNSMLAAQKKRDRLAVPGYSALNPSTDLRDVIAFDQLKTQIANRGLTAFTAYYDTLVDDLGVDAEEVRRVEDAAEPFLYDIITRREVPKKKPIAAQSNPREGDLDKSMNLAIRYLERFARNREARIPAEVALFDYIARECLFPAFVNTVGWHASQIPNATWAKILNGSANMPGRFAVYPEWVTSGLSLVGVTR